MTDLFAPSGDAAQAPQQLSLGICLDDEITFDNFFTAEGSVSRQLVALLRQQLQPLGESYIYLWGGQGAGITHLLQAACLQAQESGAGAVYLPLRELWRFDPRELLGGLESMELVCLDDIDRVAGSAEWERALFHFFNRLRDGGGRLLVGAHVNLSQLPIALADLASRLQWGANYQLCGLSDEHKQLALQSRAQRRGLEMTDEVAQYIVQRAPRAMKLLFASLERLDSASLAQQRKLTIPFVKTVLGL